VAILGWVALLVFWASAVQGRPPATTPLGAFAGTLRYFTVQSNLMVVIWLTVAAIFWKEGQGHPLLRPLYKGAFTVYISVTFIVFATLLAPLVDPHGIDRFVNTVTHYITPIAFIVDFLLFERDRPYQWRYAFYWLAYPAAYLLFALIHGGLTGDYIYPFLDLGQLGLGGLAGWLAILFVLFVVLGVLFVGASKVGFRKGAS
jgi:hypothetical protein